MAEEYEGEEQRHLPRTPVSEFVYDRFGITTSARVKQVTVGSAPTLIAGVSGNRVQLMVINNSAGVVYANITPEVASDYGWVLSAGGGALKLTVEDDGEAVTAEIWAICAAGGLVVTVFETVVGGG